MTASPAYFDRHVADQQRASASAGTWAMCYEQQVALVESLIAPGMTILDVGCGPRLPYKATGAHIIGLDPSAESLAANLRINEPICGTAERIPLPAHSVDLTVAYYALHHMTGRSVWGTRQIRRAALFEMWRVTKYDGQILVFEVTPNRLGAALQALLWPTAKRLLGDRLDAYFWPAGMYDDAMTFAPHTVETFSSSPWTWFAPMLAAPWLRIPRWLYPMTPTLYRWSSRAVCSP